MTEVFEASWPVPVLPVIGAVPAGHAAAVAGALGAAGIRAVEFTLRGPEAVDAVRAAAGAEVVVGAGTVCTIAQFDAVVDAGAAFVVSPGFDADLARHALAAGVPYVPGVATASEVMAARALGLRVLKFFPAEAMGGPAVLRAFAGPFPDVVFVPTGGVGPTTMGAYLALPNVRLVGGSWLVTPDELASGEVDHIADRVRALR